MSWLDALVIVAAGIGAGTINTVVGSGTLLTFPTLVLLGVPPLQANVANTVGLAPGSLSGAIGYRRELAGQRHRLVRLGAASGVGGLAGGIALLVAPAAVFDAVVPVLVLAAVVAMALQPRLARVVASRRAARDHAAGAALGAGLVLGVALTGTYGGYFGAAQGVVLLALLGTLVDDDLQRLNALKNVLAFMPNAVSAILFAVVTDVDWAIAGLIAVGSVIGGQVGARIGRRLSPTVLRAVVVAIGLAAVWQLTRG